MLDGQVLKTLLSRTQSKGNARAWMCKLHFIHSEILKVAAPHHFICLRA